MAKSLESQASPLVHDRSKAASKRAHKVLLKDQSLWTSLPFHGIQPGLGRSIWENRGCVCCGSTLNRRITMQEAFRILAEQVGISQRSLEALMYQAPRRKLLAGGV